MKLNCDVLTAYLDTFYLLQGDSCLMFSSLVKVQLFLLMLLTVPIPLCVVLSAKGGRICRFQEDQPLTVVVRLPRQYVVSLILDECAFSFSF